MGRRPWGSATPRAKASRSRPVWRSRATWSRPSPREMTRRLKRWRRQSSPCRLRSPSGRPPSMKTARRRASPGSTSPCSTSIRQPMSRTPSAKSGGLAITYRQRVGRFVRPSVGVIIQALLNPVVAGVLFTEHPVTGADERLIEASWGLGEAVVAGLVVPDHFRLDRSGRVLERKVGRKHIAIRSLPNGGTFEEQLPNLQVKQLCLDDAQLAALGELALQCEKVYGPRRDIEWAFQDGRLYLLQCRAVTTGKARSEAPSHPPRRDPIAALRQVELFDGMDRRQAEQIARLLKERRFAKGETVIMEGSGGSAFFIIDSGQA